MTYLCGLSCTWLETDPGEMISAFLSFCN